MSEQEATTDDGIIRLARDIPGVGCVTFEQRPTGYRAYHFTAVGGKPVRLPSVTTILGQVIPKHALLDWYEARGAEAATVLSRNGGLKGVSPDMAVEVTRAAGMGARNHAGSAAKRGVRIHDVLQAYAESGTVPNPSEYEPEDRGYIRGLMRWLLDYDPEPITVEQLVVSPVAGYAGRYDLRANIGGRDTLVDLKTNRRAQIYREAQLQITAYALAEVAVGGEPPEDLLLVAVGPDGEYAPAEPGYGTQAAWVKALDFYRALQTMQEPKAIPA